MSVLDGVTLNGGGGKQGGPKKCEKSAPICSKHFGNMKKNHFKHFWKNQFFMILGDPESRRVELLKIYLFLVFAGDKTKILATKTQI